MSDQDKNLNDTSDEVGLIIGGDDTSDIKKKLNEEIEKEKAPKKLEKKPEEESPKEKKGDNFCKQLLLTFQSMIAGKGKGGYHPKFIERREMRNLIEDHSPIFYDASIQKLHTSFPEHIYSIYKELKKLEILFEELLKEPEDIDYSKPIFFLEYVNGLLKDPDRIFLKEIDDQYFENLIGKEENPEEKLKERLKELENRIEEVNKSAILHYTSYIEKIITIMQYPFIQFFQVFDKHFSTEKDYRPKFQPVFGRVGSSEIRTLNSYFLSVDSENIPENYSIHFDHIIEDIKMKVAATVQFDEDEDISPSERKKQEDELKAKLAKYDFTSQQLNYIFTQIQELNKKKILEALVKLMTDDFEYTPPRPPRKEGFLYKKYLTMTHDKILFNYRQSFEKIKEAIIQGEILKFFSISNLSELMYIENYEESINQNLESRGMHGFQYVLLSAIYKSFTVKVYDAVIRKIINLIQIEGNFIKKREGQFFSDSYYQFDKEVEKFKLLENDFKEAEADIGEILRFANGEIKEPGFLPVIERKVREQEGRIIDAITDGVKLYIILFEHMQMIKNDWLGQNKPTMLANVKSISGTGNKRFFDGLSKSIDLIEKFLDLASRFSVMESIIKKD